MISLTPKGAQLAMQGARERKKAGYRLLTEPCILEYLSGHGLCYDAAGFVRFCLGENVNQRELQILDQAGWYRKFNFKHGRRWSGRDRLPSGAAVAFYRKNEKEAFHVAICTGGAKIRGVNSLFLGLGWREVDLQKALKKPDRDGYFSFDGTKVEVYISRV